MHHVHREVVVAVPLRGVRRDLGLGISAPPITYAVNGKQYVAMIAATICTSEIESMNPPVDQM